MILLRCSFTFIGLWCSASLASAVRSNLLHGTHLQPSSGNSASRVEFGLSSHLQGPPYDIGVVFDERKLVMKAITMSYLVTQGDNFIAGYAKSTLDADKLQKKLGDGWERVTELDHDGKLGMHGIVLQNTEERKAIIAIRGTDLTVTKDGFQPQACKEGSGCRADLCADKAMFDNLPSSMVAGNASTAWRQQRPAWCDSFGSGELDYIGQAKDFVKKAVSHWEGYDIVLCGHSLGAGLSMIVGSYIIHSEPALLSSRHSSLQVIGVSAPPFSHLLPDDVDHLGDQFTLVYNDLDPLHTATRKYGGVRGARALCFRFRLDSATAQRVSMHDLRRQCSECDQNIGKPTAEFGAVWPAGNDCDTCWAHTHALSAYLNGQIESWSPCADLSNAR